MSAALETPCTPSAYRALIMRLDGGVINTQKLIAADDDEACALAQAMVDGHAVELWDGLRYIAFYPAID